jgi:taurine-pyruvate aminotransferase
MFEDQELDKIIESDKANVWHHLSQHKAINKEKKQEPLMMVKGEGSYIWDSKGNKYLDASSGGVWCVNVGYGRDSIVDAMSKQLKQLNFFAATAATPPNAIFAKKLIEKMPGMSRVYFASSGSEANEKAFKIVRQISKLKYGGKKYKILYRERDYHGSTIATLSATGQSQRKEQYGPYVPGFVEFGHCSEYRNQFDSTENYGIQAALELEKKIIEEGPDSVGAVILEPITAGGGVIIPPEGYWPKIAEIFKKYNVLLHIDEVVCGLGRTGKWFGYQHYGIQPDIVTIAKGIASSYAAISCTVTTEAIFDEFLADSDDVMGYFRDISTFGGCTGGPAAAIENLRILEDEKLVENSALMGDYLLEKLKIFVDKFSFVGDVRGKGLLLGIELVKDKATKEPVHESMSAQIAAACMKKGLIIGRTNRSFKLLNNTLCFCPVMTLTHDQADFIVQTLDNVFSDITC